MTSSVHDDPLLRALAALPEVEPDPARSERVRARCRARLNHRGAPPIARVEPAGGGTAWATYAWHLLRLVLQ